MATRRERLEKKLENRRVWAQKRADLSLRLSQEATDMVSAIPMGQPILLGHHSERGHRRLLEKVDNKMCRAVESSNMAKYHNDKAAGLNRQLEKTIFSDDSDAIERLEEKIAGLEAERARNKAVNAIIRKKKLTGDEKLHQITELVGSESFAKLLLEDGGFPAYKSGYISANIKRCRERIACIKSQQERTVAAEEAGGLSINRNAGNGWCTVTFTEKPEREILTALKSAGFRWRNGCWAGDADKIPQEVLAMEGEV